MKFSVNLAQKYSNVDIKSIPKDELLKLIGAQLGAVEDVIDWSERFDGVVVAKIVKCDKHPDADRLNVCMIDDGGRNQDVSRDEDGLIQVVCGAPNARAGIFVAWLAPGVTVPNSMDTEPFVLESRGIRGVISNGMLASPHELGISDDHSGILEITAADSGREPVVGDDLTKYYGLDDLVIDCENKMFTHRPDCFGNLGIAREVAGISGQHFISPEWYRQPISFDVESELNLSIDNKAVELVPRFMAIALDNIKVAPSPMWLQTCLVRAGIKPINNVVDVTNYVMHLTGQPLHAFDYDKVDKLSDRLQVFPRLSNPGEKIELLGQKEIELTGEEIVISTDRQAIALAGVMGGAATEVDNNTTRIIVECATFDMYNIRRTSMRYGLFTDAVTRFNKGQSPLQNPAVLGYAVKNMIELTGAKVASRALDIANFDTEENAKKHVDVEVDFINTRLGTDLDAGEVSTLLENVEFDIDTGLLHSSLLKVNIPFWRMDIEQPEDIVEEVGRLYGFDKLDILLPIRSTKPSARNKLFDFKYELRDRLSRSGANEVLTYSFVHSDLLKKTNISADEHCYHIRNAISPDLQYYRPALMPSLLSKVHANIKAGSGSTDNQFAIFEIGKRHQRGIVDQDGLPLGVDSVAMVVAADDKTVDANNLGTAYYLAKKYLDTLTNNRLGYKPITDKPSSITAAPYAIGRSAVVYIDDNEVGVIGEFDQQVAKSLKLPAFSAGFELDVDKMRDIIKLADYTPMADYPPIKQDVTVEVPGDTSYIDVYQGIRQKLVEISVSHDYKFDVEPLFIYKQVNSDTKKLTFRIVLWHQARTLNSEEVRAVTDGIVAD